MPERSAYVTAAQVAGCAVDRGRAIEWDGAGVLAEPDVAGALVDDEAGRQLFARGGMVRRTEPDRTEGLHRDAICGTARSCRDGSTCCPTATCSSRSRAHCRRRRRTNRIGPWRCLQKRSGAVKASANRITLLRDANGDGTVENRAVFLQNLNRPFGMVLRGRTRCTSRTPMAWWRSLSRRPDQNRGRRAKRSLRPAGRRLQQPLDAQHHRQPRRHEAVRHRRLGQQRRRERHGRRRSTAPTFSR